MKIIFGEDNTSFQIDTDSSNYDKIEMEIAESYIKDGFVYSICFNHKSFNDWVKILRWLNDVYQTNEIDDITEFTNKRTRQYIAFNDQWHGVMAFLFKSEAELLQFKLVFCD